MQGQPEVDVIFNDGSFTLLLDSSSVDSGEQFGQIMVTRSVAHSEQSFLFLILDLLTF